MADGFAEMDAMIGRLQALGPALVRDAAPKVAVAMKAELTSQISKGVGPDGKAWAPTQDGRRPLVNAAKALEVTPVGNVVVARLTGPEARHHLGAVKGGVKRQILPTGAIPAPVTRAIGRVLTSEFSLATRGSR